MKVAEPLAQPPFAWSRCWIGRAETKVASEFRISGVNARHEVTGILPPIRTFWNDAAYHKPDPYFGGQYVDEELIKLADQIPPKYTT